ncbi:hypothetical protein MMC19_007753, partial [Ptychographa xylographoides]|nr:hypothetical protein [Ptychographa xylographoides]
MPLSRNTLTPPRTPTPNRLSMAAAAAPPARPRRIRTSTDRGPVIRRLSNGNGTSSSERLPFDAASLPSVHDISSGTYPPPSRPGLSFSQSYNDAYYPSRRNASPPRPIPYPSYGGGAYRPEYAYTTGQYYERSPFSNGGVGSYALGFDGVSDHGDGKQKRRRGNLPKAVTDTLRVWFTEHIAHPYPTEEEKQILMGQTGLTISQISNWFINARRRSLPQMTKQAQTEAEIRDGQSALAAAK